MTQGTGCIWRGFVFAGLREGEERRALKWAASFPGGRVEGEEWGSMAMGRQCRVSFLRSLARPRLVMV